jgi:hypothetical protein
LATIFLVIAAVNPREVQNHAILGKVLPSNRIHTEGSAVFWDRLLNKKQTAANPAVLGTVKLKLYSK